MNTRATPSASRPDTTVVRPRRGWIALDLLELWRYRELLYFFAWRDVKVRYKQTLLGAAWAVLQPLLLMLVFSVFLGRFVGVPSGEVPYPLFVYAALVPWTLFSQSLTTASRSLVENANLVSKIFFPRLLLPVAAAGSFLLDFGIALVLLVAMMAAYDVSISAAVLWLPFFGMCGFVAAVAIAVLLSALNARYRDVQYALSFLVQVWLFATPVAYPASLVPERWRIWYGLNPMAGVIEGFRWSLLGTGETPGTMVFVSIGMVALTLLLGLAYFRRVELTLADVI